MHGLRRGIQGRLLGGEDLGGDPGPPSSLCSSFHFGASFLGLLISFPSQSLPFQKSWCPSVRWSFDSLRSRTLTQQTFSPAPPTGIILLPPAGWPSRVCKRARRLAGSSVGVPPTSPTVRDLFPRGWSAGQTVPLHGSAEGSAHPARGRAQQAHSAGERRRLRRLGATLQGQPRARPGPEPQGGLRRLQLDPALCACVPPSSPCTSGADLQKRLSRPLHAGLHRRACFLGNTVCGSLLSLNCWGPSAAAKE